MYSYGRFYRQQRKSKVYSHGYYLTHLDSSAPLYFLLASADREALSDDFLCSMSFWAYLAFVCQVRLYGGDSYQTSLMPVVFQMTHLYSVLQPSNYEDSHPSPPRLMSPDSCSQGPTSSFASD